MPFKMVCLSVDTESTGICLQRRCAHGKLDELFSYSSNYNMCATRQFRLAIPSDYIASNNYIQQCDATFLA